MNLLLVSIYQPNEFISRHLEVCFVNAAFQCTNIFLSSVSQTEAVSQRTGVNHMAWCGPVTSRIITNTRPVFSVHSHNLHSVWSTSGQLQSVGPSSSSVRHYVNAFQLRTVDDRTHWRVCTLGLSNECVTCSGRMQTAGLLRH